MKIQPLRGAGQRMALAIFLLSNAQVGAVPELPAVLSQPAAQTARSQRAATLAVTRAGNRIVAVGEQGVVLLSDDNGVSWRQAKVPVTVSLTAVQFVNDRTGWAVGHLGVVLHTDDGGENWVKQLDGAAAAAKVLDAARKIVPADSHEAQQAVASAEQLVADGPDKPFLDLYFKDEHTGFIVGAYNLIFRTDDGGNSWQSLSYQIENPEGLHLYAIRPAGADIVIAGEQGLLLKSTDGGSHFTALASPYEGSYFGLVTAPSGVMVAYGLRGNVYRSGDGGQSWQHIPTDVAAGISAATTLADGAIVLTAQTGEVLISRDEGQTFSPYLPATGLPLAGVVQSADSNLIVASLTGVKCLSVDAKQ